VSPDGDRLFVTNELANPGSPARGRRDAMLLAARQHRRSFGPPILEPMDDAEEVEAGSRGYARATDLMRRRAFGKTGVANRLEPGMTRERSCANGVVRECPPPLRSTAALKATRCRARKLGRRRGGRRLDQPLEHAGTPKMISKLSGFSF